MSMIQDWWFKVVFTFKITCIWYIYIYIQIQYINYAIKQPIYMFLAKTSHFIVVTVPLTNEIID